MSQDFKFVKHKYDIFVTKKTVECLVLCCIFWGLTQEVFIFFVQNRSSPTCLFTSVCYSNRGKVFSTVKKRSTGNIRTSSLHNLLIFRRNSDTSSFDELSFDVILTDVMSKKPRIRRNGFRRNVMKSSSPWARTLACGY